MLHKVLIYQSNIDINHTSNLLKIGGLSYTVSSYVQLEHRHFSTEK